MRTLSICLVFSFCLGLFASVNKEKFHVYISDSYTEIELLNEEAQIFYKALLKFEISEDCSEQGNCNLAAKEIICQDGLSTPDEEDVSSCYEDDGTHFKWRSKELSENIFDLLRVIDSKVQKKLKLELGKEGQKMRYKIKNIQGRRSSDYYYSQIKFLITREVLKK